MKNPLLFFSRSRDKPTNAISSAVSFTMGTSSAGKRVNEYSAMQLTTVYACVRVIAETMASLPLHVYKRTANGTEKAVNHPIYKVLHDEANGEMTAFVFRELMLTHLLLWGNSYAQIVRNRAGQVMGLYPLMPDRMRVDRDEHDKIVYYYIKDGEEITLRPDQVLHVPGMGFDGLIGYSPIAVARNAIGLGIAAEEYGSKFFANGATPAGVLTHPKTVKDPKKLRESWNNAYGGSGRSGQTAILEEGMEFKKIAMPNNEAQFLEARKFQVAEICRIYRVPPHMVSDLERATFSNIEHQSINFASYTLMPWCARIEQALRRVLFTEGEKKGFFVSHNLDGLRRGDYKSRMEGYAIGKQNGWMSTNDIRILENMNPIPADEGGDAYLVNGNMISLKTAVENMVANQAISQEESQGGDND